MPEGDTVFRTSERLHRALAGRPLTVSDLRWPHLSTVSLVGRTISQVVARGKHLLIRCDGRQPVTLHTHLRMEGTWRIRRSLTSTHRKGPTRLNRRWDPTDQIRLVLANDEWTATGYRLGMMNIVLTKAESSVVGHLGPDLLGPDWDASLAQANLQAQPSTPIGSALLDQRNLAGIGTVYLAEILFLTGVSPWTPVDQVPDLGAVLRRARYLMAANAQRATRSTTGFTAPGERFWVYGRDHRGCRRCGSTIRVGKIGQAPQQRQAFFCPQCQRSAHATS
ncbi:MAG: DNA-formamidopyrimidine glycosylase family protein [Actinomycetota bacterium]